MDVDAGCDSLTAVGVVVDDKGVCLERECRERDLAIDAIVCSAAVIRRGCGGGTG